VYFDEPNRHEFVTYRMDGSFIANQLSAEGKKDKAIQVLDKIMTNITEHSYSYDYTAYFVASAYYRAGALAKANALTDKLVRNAIDDVNWITTLNDEGKAAMADEVKQQFQIMQSLSSTAYQSGDTVTAKTIYGKMQALGPKVKDLLNTKSGNAGGGGDDQ
jgi:tetratricopeptide (TPR) repeat protein